jgi:hypothetical protein
MRRSPIVSETDAFRLTVASAALAFISVLVGWLMTPLAGVVVFTVVALAGFCGYMSRPDRSRRLPLRAAAQERHPHGAPAGRRHVIVVANETLAGDALGAYIRGIDGGRVELDILAPVLTSRTHLAYTDVDAETRQARARLGRSLSWARSQGFAARGEIGDPSPTTALEDELRDFGADEVIVATSQAGPTRWQERAELEQLREELDIPVKQVAVG